MMDEKDMFAGEIEEISRDNTTQPEPENQQDNTEELEKQREALYHNNVPSQTSYE